jgi:hypothetical protein
MSDAVQVVIVTLVALAALVVLVRPMFVSGKTAPRAGGSCGGCAAGEQELTSRKRT